MTAVMNKTSSSCDNSRAPIPLSGKHVIAQLKKSRNDPARGLA